MGMTNSRCDLHLHSSASTGNDEWYTRFFGCPESYADPIRQYELCKARGMTLVTLTDHDTIAGGLALIDRPDFFLSEEVTTQFPETECVMHVLAWNITPKQHDQIQAVRKDIYRLCELLNREGIAHGLAHPLLSPSWNLDAETFEKLLLLFPTMEAVNGLTDRRIEPDLSTLLERLTPDVIEALAAKHGFPAYGRTPHKKALSAGSDDHVHRRCGSVYVEIDEQGLAPGDFVARCTAGEGRVRGHQANLNAMTLCVKHTTYHHFKERANERADYRNPFVDVMDLVGGRDPRGDGSANGFVASLLEGARRAALEPGGPMDILRIPHYPSEEEDGRVMESIARLSDRVLERALDDLVGAAQDFDLYGLFGALRDLAGGLVIAAPAFFAADHFGKQEQQSRRVLSEWRAYPLPPRPERLALFSDSLEHVDGVSTWCRRFIDQARAAGREVLVPHCGDAPSGFHRLPALTSCAVPLYEHFDFHVPSLIETLDWVWREGITHVELATPGPMGMVGLLVAKVLRLPVTASYHTEVPSLVKSLGGNLMMEKTARRYLAWFYGRVDRVFTFSSGSRDALIDMGVRPDKLAAMPVAVDPSDFSPEHRSTAVFDFLNLDVGDQPVILSVGRISGEKNLPVIVDAVGRLQGRRTPPVLVVVGDGPERENLENRYRHLDYVRFAGLQRGDTLKKLYASASAFVFASRVDTLGLVNMEAMASGLPVFVPADACIAEFVTHGLSAECYEFGPAGLAAALTRVLNDPSRAAALGEGGRRLMIERWQQAPFSQIWKSFTGEA